MRNDQLIFLLHAPKPQSQKWMADCRPIPESEDKSYLPADSFHYPNSCIFTSVLWFVLRERKLYS